MTERAAPTRFERLLPFLLVPVSLLADPGAALPRLSYYFRDFSVTFYPLRLFAARELREGRFPFWNPFIHEGAFALPVLYPPDLLHAFWPGPVAVSWLLTLHLPLAALAAYALARGLGAERLGAFAAGTSFALGGLTLSALNLYVFLQALALAPLLVLAFRRAAERGGRAVLPAALALAVSLSTLALEFVAQAVLLGLLLGLVGAKWREAAPRLLLSLAVGVAVAGVPIFVTGALLSETARGAGFPVEVALGNAVHPVSLLQMVVPEVFGSLSSPVEAWWGGRFFTKGFPYFLSLYLGPLVLALAVVGAGAVPHRLRWTLLGSAAIGLWYALGAWGGLASALQWLPFFHWFRFPAKAMLLPHLVACILAGLGAGRLQRGEGWPAFARTAAGGAAVALAVALGVTAFPAAAADWAGIERASFPAISRAVAVGAVSSAIVGLVGTAVWAAMRHGLVSSARGAILVCAVIALDLARAGAGLNPQTTPRFFDPLPELAAERLDRLDGGRVFSYGPDHSPAFRAFLAAGGRRLGLTSFFVNRQLLAPYNNILDRVEAPEAKDLTSFVPRPPELGPEDYDPTASERILPLLRNASVARVLSMDPLASSQLRPRSVIPLGRPGLEIHVYELEGTWPRAWLACRVVRVRRPEEGLAAPYAAGFDPARDVALEGGQTASCRQGGVWRLAAVPGDVRYRVVADGPGYLVTRDSFARGWQAEVDGRRAAVLRANGKHQAVPVAAGAHEVVLRYHPPGFAAGLVATGLGLALALLLLARPVLRADGPRG